MSLRFIIFAVLMAVAGFQPSGAQESREKLTHAIALEQSGVFMEAISTYEDYLKESPGDSPARARLIALLMKLNQQDQAMPHIAVLKKQDPNNPLYAQYFKLDETNRKMSEEAQQQDYENRIKQPGVSAAVLLEYSKFLKQRGNEKRSLEVLKLYLNAKPDDDVSRLDYAKRQSWRKDFKGAQDEAAKVVANQPGNVEANSLLGDLLYWKNDEEGALVAYRRAQASSPGNQEIKRKIGKIVDAPGYREKKLTESLRKEPDTKVANDLAKLYLDQKREWEADSLVKRRLLAAPEDAEAKKLEAEIQKKRDERYAKQIAQYQTRLKTAPNDTTVVLALARYYAEVPSFDSSIVMYDRYMRIYPLDNRIRMERARILMWSGNTSQALQEYRIITLSDSTNGEAELNLADCMMMEDVSVDEAEAIYKRQLTLYPDSARIRLGYADVLRKQGRYDEAKEQYSSVLVREPDNSRARDGLDALGRDLTPLIRRMEKSLESNPEDLATRRRLASFYFDMRLYWNAEEQVKYLLGKTPNDTQLKALLEEIQRRQRSYRAGVLDSLQAYVIAKPEDWKARKELADALAGVNRVDDATMHYKTIIIQRPDDLEIRRSFAEMLVTAQKLKEAIAVYEDLVERNPGNFDLRVRLAQLYSWHGDYDNATRVYESALQINPESVDCQLALADIARWRGDPYTAYDGYNRILAADPGNQKAHEAMNELEGTFIRGAQVYVQDAKDSEHFHLRETRVTGSFSLSYRTRAQVGWGRVNFEQDDPILVDEYSELGWFLFGQIDYRIDPLTRAAGQMKFYTFTYRKPQSLRIEVEHNFKDVPSLIGLNALAYYQSQEALFDVASSRKLAAWHARLKSDKLGLNCRYQTDPKWLAEGELALFSISDGNTRTDFAVEGRRVLSKVLQVGLRYESVAAKKAVVEYWSPKEYQTVTLVAQLENTLNRWSYELHGGVGRVLNTNDALRNFSAQVQWKITQWAYLSGGILDLTTTRADGQYHYRGASLSLTIER